MAVTHKKTVNFSGVAGGGQANYNWQDPNTTWIQWPPTQVGSTDEWEFIVAANGTTSQRSAVIEVRHWDYANDNTLTDSFTITQAGTAPQPSYDSLSGAPDPVAEGNTLTFTVQTSNVPDGTTVGYTLSGQNIDTNDIGVALTGTITINSNTGTLAVPITADQVAEGNESIVCTLGATDSAGNATGGLTTNVQINDVTNDVTVTLNWYEGSNTSANWFISSSSLSSGTASNVSAGASSATFTAAPGATLQFTINGQTSGTDFVSVGGNDIITLANNAAGGSIISENTSNLPEQISWIYSYTVPSSNTSSNATFDAETIADSTTKTIALYGPLGSNYSCAETVVSATANYDDANGTAQNPQPAVGVMLNGISLNAQESWLVVAGSGAQTTTGSATNLIGQTLGIVDSEIMSINACVPQTGQIWATSAVDNPSTDFTTGGTGQMSYTMNRASSSPQGLLIGVKMNPDGNLDNTGLDPEVYFASDAAGTQATVPWFVEIQSINNSASSGTQDAVVTIMEGVVAGSGSSGSQGSNPSIPVGSSATKEGEGSVSGSTPEGQPGSVDPAKAGPSPGGSNNQVYIIIKHPLHNGNYISINYTGPSSITTTQAPTEYNFNWSNPGTNSAPIFMGWNTNTGTNAQPFTWDGPALTGGTAAQSDFNWYNWNGLEPGANVTVRNASDNGAHTGGNGIAKFYFPTAQTVSQQGPYSNGVVFDGNYTISTSSDTDMYVVMPAHCHVAGTVMNLADGSTKLVEDLQEGDVLKSYTITGLGEDEQSQPWQDYSSQINQWSATETTATVTQISSSGFGEYINFNSGLTKVTGEHTVLVKAAGNDISFKAAKDVIVGDSFYVNDAWVEITSAETVTEDVMAYTIDTETSDIYVADGILWHNEVGGQK